MATGVDEQLKRTRGRPKTFDRSVALHQALKLFWERGYIGTSFDDLIGAMGISPSSFYNSFGSKERLYREATEAYAAQSSKWFAAELEAATDTRTAFHQMLKKGTQEITRTDLPTGCMISLACTQVPPALELGASDDGRVPLRRRSGDGREDSTRHRRRRHAKKHECSSARSFLQCIVPGHGDTRPRRSQQGSPAGDRRNRNASLANRDAQAISISGQGYREAGAAKFSCLRGRSALQPSGKLVTCDDRLCSMPQFSLSVIACS